MLYMFFADGFEEVEAVATLDVIRRAGIEIQSVGIGSEIIQGSHNMKFICDKTDSEISVSNNLKGIILPGGMPGTTNLMNDSAVNKYIDFCAENNLLICAICAAPMILGRKGLLNGKEAICFPGFEDELSGAVISDKFVCRDGNIITAKGMGVALEFGLALVAALRGEDTAAQLRAAVMAP